MMRRVITLLFLLCGSACFGPAPLPPQVQQLYPNYELIDEHGEPVSLRSFQGNVTLIQTVSMGCAICQSFAGAAHYGPFGSVMPHSGVLSFESYLNRFAPGALASGKLQIVQIVFLNTRGEPPSAEELAAWSDHFQLRKRGIVALGAPMTLSQTVGRKLVPGFQLLDENFILRADSTGSIPRHNFTDQLLPELAKLLGVSKPKR